MERYFYFNCLTNSQVRDRFCSFLSLHLEYFNFQWNWESWEFVFTDQKKHSKKINFLKDLFEEMRDLSFYEKLLEFIPEKFQVFLPMKSVEKPFPNNSKITEAMKLRKSNFEIKTMLTDKNDSIYSILYLGSTSYSHLLSFTKRYLDLILELEKKELFEIVRDFWKFSNQVCSNLSLILKRCSKSIWKSFSNLKFFPPIKF
jgi:hypothetical protein